MTRQSSVAIADPWSKPKANRPTHRRVRLILLPDDSATSSKIEFSTGCGGTGFALQWWDNVASARAARVIAVGNVTITGVNAAPRH